MSVSNRNTKQGLPGLARARKAKGYTQETFADAVGLHRVTIASYESATKDPGISKVRRFAALLECSTDELMQPHSEEVQADA